MPAGVPALTRGLDILELFLGADGELTAPQVGARLHLPRSTAHELIRTLASRGYLERGDGARTFRLGPRTLELGNAYGSGIDLMREARAAVTRVTELTGETSHAAVLSGIEVFYVARAESTHAVQMVSAVGQRLPAHATALGKALLASLSEQEVQARYVGQTLAPLSTRTITSLRRLEAELRVTRESGIAWDDCEANENVRSVAASATDRKGLLFAVSVDVPTVRWSLEAATRFAQVVRQEADLLSMRLGASRDHASRSFQEAIAINPPPPHPSPLG
ncbi:MAG TPA: IclR family transcriptional regulator [Acidimicrobiales bacterium]|nr:IclR family transcriptional regulator [Acidimicrobiales bacterium]